MEFVDVVPAVPFAVALVPVAADDDVVSVAEVEVEPFVVPALVSVVDVVADVSVDVPVVADVPLAVGGAATCLPVESTTSPRLGFTSRVSKSPAGVLYSIVHHNH